MNLNELFETKIGKFYIALCWVILTMIVIKWTIEYITN